MSRTLEAGGRSAEAAALPARRPLTGTAGRGCA